RKTACLAVVSRVRADAGGAVAPSAITAAIIARHVMSGGLLRSFANRPPGRSRPPRHPRTAPDAVPGLRRDAAGDMREPAPRLPFSCPDGGPTMWHAGCVRVIRGE